MKNITKTIMIFTFIISIIGASKVKANNLTNINVALDWVPNTNHTGIIVAQSLGYYKKLGLKINVLMPSKSSVEQLVANNYAMVGISSSGTLVGAVVHHIPIISIAAVIAHNTSGFYSLKYKNITRPKDFENKNYGSWGGKLEVKTVKDLMKRDNANPNLLNVVMIGNLDFFKVKNIDFVWGFEASTGIEAKIKHIKVNYIPILKYRKIDSYTPIIITNKTALSKDKEILKKFMKATQEGYNYAIKHPNKAANILLTKYPELNKQVIIASQKYLADKYKADAPYWGYQSKKVWRKYIKWLYDNKMINRKIEVNEVFSNQLFM